ncbi:MAG: PH domain-containing protein [Nocardioidaceae bacterium]
MKLPKTYRPLGARMVAGVTSVCIVSLVVVLWVLLPHDVQNQLSWIQRSTILAVFVAILVGLNALFRTSVHADAEGLTVINGYRSHRYVWEQIVSITLTPNRPWAAIDLDDGTSMQVMALQSADGARASRSTRELARVIAVRSRPERDN